MTKQDQEVKLENACMYLLTKRCSNKYFTKRTSIDILREYSDPKNLEFENKELIAFLVRVIYRCYVRTEKDI